jgi:hypothetical protein
MKKRIVKCVAGACVAGMVLTSSGVGVAVAAPSETDNWSASKNENVDIYGPPSAFGGAEEPIQVLYGPPSVFDRTVNPMTVKTHNKSVSQAALAKKKKTFTKAITVKNAVGKVTYAKVFEGSSKRLSVNKKTGAITVKRGTKAGVYSIVVDVMASGDENYMSAYELAVVKVRVK